MGYSTRIVPKGGAGGSTDWLTHIARAPMSGKMATGTWQKWYDGSWSQPGVGGLESNLVPATAANPNGYTPVAKDYNPANTGNVDQQIAAGTLPPSSPLAVMNISYSAYLGLYIATPQSDQSSNKPQQFYVTDDLSTQKWYLAADSGSHTQASWYRWLVDGANATNSTILGKTFRYYCVIECGNFGGYTDITLGSSSPALPPVDTSRTYVIGNGSGQVLTQVSGSSATTSAAANGSTLQSWSFTGNGDGSFTVTNAATGQALGVDSSSTANRAWGTAPTATTVSGSPTVGRQWFVLKNTSPSGTFRLVNRYSGLVLGMSSASGRLVETTPARNWTNTTGSSVGGTRTAADQTLTLTPSGAAGAETVTVVNPGPQSGAVGTAASLRISANDSRGNPLTYSATGLPAGLTVDPSTGTITGTPTGPGTRTVTVTATATSGTSGSTSFTWTVTPADLALNRPTTASSSSPGRLSPRAWPPTAVPGRAGPARRRTRSGSGSTWAPRARSPGEAVLGGRLRPGLPDPDLERRLHVDDRLLHDHRHRRSAEPHRPLRVRPLRPAVRHRTRHRLRLLPVVVRDVRNLNRSPAGHGSPPAGRAAVPARPAPPSPPRSPFGADGWSAARSVGVRNRKPPFDHASPRNRPG